MYRPLWSAAILEELQFNEQTKLTKRLVPDDEARESAQHLVDEMRRAFDDAEVEGWEGLEGTYGLPDPDDEHVVAAAVVGGAGAIVTANFKDFPANRLPAGLEVLSAAEFAFNTVSLDPNRSLRAVGEIARRSGRQGPVLSVEDILDLLVERYRLHDAVAVLREAL
jgi:predicted nucleic acid-binding protein